jgi:hypothetical protein
MSRFESSGRYRWRTRLRTRLPWGLVAFVPKGMHDCGNHEWYKASDDEDNCYHCSVGVRRPSMFEKGPDLFEKYGLKRES